MGETTWCPSPSWEKRVNAFVLGTALMIKGIAVRRQSLVVAMLKIFTEITVQLPKLEYPTLFVNPRYPKNYWAAINVSPRQAQITWHNHCIFKRTMLSVLSDRLIDKVVFDQEMFHVYSQNLCYFLEGIH